jgi:hypothetical protein
MGPLLPAWGAWGRMGVNLQATGPLAGLLPSGVAYSPQVRARARAAGRGSVLVLNWGGAFSFAAEVTGPAEPGEKLISVELVTRQQKRAAAASAAAAAINSNKSTRYSAIG